MYKKWLSILSAVGVSAVAASSVVSCVAPQYADGEDGQRIVLVTDGGQINDRAFNQAAYEGIEYFSGDGGKEFHNWSHESNHSYVIPPDSSYSNLISGYKLALTKKANTLVMPGFTHASVVPDMQQYLGNKNVILIDCEYDYKDNTVGKNVISLTFSSELAGFLAGFNTSYWATTRVDGKLQGDRNGDNHVTIGAFEGQSNKFSTDNYVWGLLLGMEAYNKWIVTQNIKGHENKDLVYSANAAGESINVEDIDSVGDGDSKFFTGTFAPGGAIKSGVLGRLFGKGSDILFPVAGGQITDAISAEGFMSGSDTQKYKPLLIGVDVNQAVGYAESAGDRFITSATKNIKQATFEALDHGDVLNLSKKGDSWLGEPTVPRVDWSTNLTGTVDGGKYLLDKNILSFNSEDKDGDGKPVEGSLAGIIVEAFKGSGAGPKQYFQGKAIAKIVTDKILPIIDKNIVKNN